MSFHHASDNANFPTDTKGNYAGANADKLDWVHAAAAYASRSDNKVYLAATNSGRELPSAFGLGTLEISPDTPDNRVARRQCNDETSLPPVQLVSDQTGGAPLSDKEKKAEPAPKESRKPDAEKLAIAKLITNLGSEDFAEREAAQKELENLSVKALPDLTVALRDKDIEIARRAQIAIDKIKDDFLPQSKNTFGEKSFEQTMKDNKHSDQKDLHNVAALITALKPLKEIDQKDANVRLEAIGETRKQLELLDKVTTDADIKAEITRLKALEEDYRNLPARKKEIDELPNNVTELKMEGSYSESELELIPQLKGLQRIEARGLAQVGEVLEKAKNLTQIGDLQLGQSCVTDADLAKLKGCPLQKSIFSLGLSGTSITDTGLKELTNFSELRALRLDQTPISDAGLKHLASMPIEHLNLDNTRISDQGLEHLSKQNKLRNLSLKGTDITDAGLVHLETAHSLRSLALDNSHISGKGLKHLSKLTELNGLSLAGNTIADDDLTHLQNLKLRYLDLSGTKISSQGLKHITPLELFKLNLQDNPGIDDRAIGTLAKIQTLTWDNIGLEKTSATPAAIEQLKRTNPHEVFLPD